mmetsp:Transcript_156609/g.502776  ORF Transcript_156609/g.502776 Transcript_156609/m.502776 type:complete len:800 (-) Transcript_156609:188-2587(-)
MALKQRGGEGAKEAGTWERGVRVFELLATGDFGDVQLVAGQPPERIAASRVLLAAASEPLARHLRHSEHASELELPGLSAVAVRAAVAFSCGVRRPFVGLSPADAWAAASLLRNGLGPTADARLDDEDEGPPSPWQSGWRAVLVLVGCLALLAAAVASYWPVKGFNMQVGGMFMDDVMIQRNAVVTNHDMDWKRLWRTDYWGLEMFDPNTWTHKSFRPLVVLTFRWNYWYHGFNSAGFHITNVAMHAGASAQLGFFAYTALRLPALWSALLAALFAAHPVHSESICYVVGRADIICTQVLMLAIQVYGPCASAAGCGALQGWLRLAVTVILILVAGLCKETGFTFFGLLVGWEALCLTRVRFSGQGGTISRCLRMVVVLVVGAAACAARLWYTLWTQIARMDPYSNPIAASDDSYVRILSYSLVHGLYMKLLVWPWFLCYDYSMDAVPLVRTLQDVRLLCPVAGYLALFQTICLVVHRLRWYSSRASRLLAEGSAIGVGFFILSFLPMTNILFPIGTLVAERLLYMPSIGMLVIVVCVTYFETRKQLWMQAFAWAFLFGVLVFWWALCYQRVSDWRSVEQITLVDGLKQLRSTRTQFNLANIYLQGQRLDEALVAYQRANSLDPEERDSMPLYHAGQILMYQGQYAEAERHLQKAVAGYFSPLTLHEEEVWHDYGLALWHVGRGMEAVQNFQNAIITNPAFPKGYNNLGCALCMLAMSQQPPNAQAMREGLQQLEQAVILAPGVPLYWRNAAVLLSLAGDRQGANEAWERWRQLDPASVAAVEATGQMPQDCVWEFYFR